MPDDSVALKTPMRTLLRRGMHTFIVTVSAVGLIAAACGGDDDAAPAATEPADTVPSESAPEPESTSDSDGEAATESPSSDT